MSQREPSAIDRREVLRRRRRVARIARSLGFRGDVEYRHVYSQSGGAQFCVGPTPEPDLLVVYAEAFERDCDLSDFSLEAIVAHECGHQALLRNPRLAAIVKKLPGILHEEVLASLIGSLVTNDPVDAATLVEKAAVELAVLGLPPAPTVRTIERLLALLRRVL